MWSLVFGWYWSFSLNSTTSTSLNPKDKKTFKSNAKGIIKALWEDQDRFSKTINNMANFKF